jgi:hypothetical protein
MCHPESTTTEQTNKGNDMTNVRGWHKITKGLYRYTNAAGKSLAYAGREAGGWEVLVIPMADPAREYKHTTKPSTLRDAKLLAMAAYKASTAQVLEEDAKILARFER